MVAAYRRDTVAMATHLVATCAFEVLREAVARSDQGSSPGRAGADDIFAMLRVRDDVTIPRAELAARVEHLRDRARALERAGGIVLGPRLARATGREILDEALRAFSGYHTTPVLEPRGDALLLVDTRLIFYYQNRLAAHGLAADLVGPRHGASPAVQMAGKPAHFALGSRPLPAHDDHGNLLGSVAARSAGAGGAGACRARARRAHRTERRRLTHAEPAHEQPTRSTPHDRARRRG